MRLLTDAQGAVTDTYTYDAFGNLIGGTGATPNEYLYAGERLDGNTGFYYLRARYMNPQSGRFFSMDSYEGSSADPRSLHKYLYAGDDPADKIDPSGRFFGGIAEVSIANSIQSVLVNIQGNLGFAVMDQLIYGGNAGLKSVAFAGILSIGTFALGSVIRTAGRILSEGGEEIVEPLRFSQISANPLFSEAEESPFSGMTIGQLVRKLHAGEFSVAQVPVRFIRRAGYRLIVNTRSSLALIRAGIPESEWNLIEVDTLENGKDISTRLAKNGLDESGTDVIRIGPLNSDFEVSDLQ